MHQIPQKLITFNSWILFANRWLYACYETTIFRDHEISLC
jgi:hypothetical protein